MFTTGDKVRITREVIGKWAGTGPWTVVKVNPRKYKLSLDSEPARILNADHGLCEAASSSDATSSTPSRGEPVSLPLLRYELERPENLRTGAIVTLKHPPAGFNDQSLFVVFKDNFDVVNVTNIGGNPDLRYWRVPVLSVIVIDPARVHVTFTS